MPGQPGFFALDERYADLSKTGDPLERLASVVDFEVFRPELDRALGPIEGRASADGRRLVDVQGSGAPGTLWDVRRTGGIPDPRSLDVHAVSELGIGRPGAGLLDDLALP